MLIEAEGIIGDFSPASQLSKSVQCADMTEIAPPC